MPPIVTAHTHWLVKMKLEALQSRKLTIRVCVLVPFVRPALITVLAIAISERITVISSSLLMCRDCQCTAVTHI